MVKPDYRPEDHTDDLVDAITDSCADQADRLAAAWPTGPIDTYGDPLQDREPMGGDPWWQEDQW